MKIGILGGTFNPPHIGHLVLAEETREKLSLDKIFFVPANLPPHKDSHPLEANHRLNMLNLTLADRNYYCILDKEIKRGGISYTIDTVEELKKEFPQDDFYLIIGSDLARGLSKWKNFKALKSKVNIVIANRANFTLEDKDDFIFIDITQVDVSSSEVRESVKKGIDVKFLVGEKVADYIKKHELYIK